MGALAENHRPKILIIVTKVPKEAATSHNYEGLRTRSQAGLPDIKVDIVALKELVFDIGRDKTRVHAPQKNIDLDNYSLVVFRLWSSQAERAATCVRYLQARGIRYIDGCVPALGGAKYTCAMGRWVAGLPFPRTIFATQKLLSQFMQSKNALIYPCIAKAAGGKKGRDNYLVHSSQELEAIFTANPEVEFVLQEYIPNAGDYRFLVFGGKIACVIKRQSESSHLHNTSQGAKADLIHHDEISETVKQDVLRSAEIEQLDMAGVDVIFDKNSGQHYFLEVNRAPQITTGAFAGHKTQAFTEYLGEAANRRYTRNSLMSSPLGVVGRHIKVDVPAWQILDLPAKVDSGAYNNALHAENIVALKSGLRFDIPVRSESGINLLSCKVDSYQQVEVKNSFGITEKRYRVPMEVVINGRSYQTDCTLANRGSMKYPLLIGRRLLRGHFLVNVELSPR